MRKANPPAMSTIKGIANALSCFSSQNSFFKQPSEMRHSSRDEYNTDDEELEERQEGQVPITKELIRKSIKINPILDETKSSDYEKVKDVLIGYIMDIRNLSKKDR